MYRSFWENVQVIRFARTSTREPHFRIIKNVKFPRRSQSSKNFLANSDALGNNVTADPMPYSGRILSAFSENKTRPCASGLHLFSVTCTLEGKHFQDSTKYF